MKAGDALFVPRQWWHDIRTENGESIAIRQHHGVATGLAQTFAYLLRAGPPVWGALARQFAWHGLLKQPYPNRPLYAGPYSVGEAAANDLKQWLGRRRQAGQ